MSTDQNLNLDYVANLARLALTDAEKGRIRPAGMQAVLELLAEIGEMSRPLPPVEKYIDTSYWERAQR